MKYCAIIVGKMVIAQNLVDLTRLRLVKFTASLGHGCLFFAYALKYNVSSVVLSKLGNIDGAYYSRSRCYYPILKGHGKAPY
jgi:hypothetical protein